MHFFCNIRLRAFLKQECRKIKASGARVFDAVFCSIHALCNDFYCKLMFTRQKNHGSVGAQRFPKMYKLHTVICAYHCALPNGNILAGDLVPATPGNEERRKGKR